MILIVVIGLGESIRCVFSFSRSCARSEIKNHILGSWFHLMRWIEPAVLPNFPPSLKTIAALGFVSTSSIIIKSLGISVKSSNALPRFSGIGFMTTSSSGLNVSTTVESKEIPWGFSLPGRFLIERFSFSWRVLLEVYTQFVAMCWYRYFLQIRSWAPDLHES